MELLITLDEPEGGGCPYQPEFENTVFDDGRYPVAFGEDDWTCTLSRLTVTTDDPMRGPSGNVIQAPKQKSEIGVCIVRPLETGADRRVKGIYDLAGMRKQIGAR